MVIDTNTHKIIKSKQIIPLHNKSEFASLSIKSQEKKFQKVSKYLIKIK